MAGRHPFVTEKDIERMGEGVPMDKIMNKIKEDGALPLLFENTIIGSLRRDHDKDDSLKAHVLMENLLSEASAALTMHYLFQRSNITAGDVDFIRNGECSKPQSATATTGEEEAFPRLSAKWRVAGTRRDATSRPLRGPLSMPSSWQRGLSNRAYSRRWRLSGEGA